MSRTAGALVLAAVVLAGCNSSGAPSSGASAGGGASTASGHTATVVVKDFRFTPGNLTVTKGTKVTWKFEDSSQHTVLAGDKSFKSKALSNDQTYSYTFNTAGSYDYICSIHQYMTGKIIVR